MISDVMHYLIECLESLYQWLLRETHDLWIESESESGSERTITFPQHCSCLESQAIQSSLECHIYC
jgi:hypothetical protein